MTGAHTAPDEGVLHHTQLPHDYPQALTPPFCRDPAIPIQSRDDSRLGCGLPAFRHGNNPANQMNVPVKVREQRVGHTSAELTLNTYTHAITSDERKFVDELGIRLGSRLFQ